jgi:hypothetical protein
MKTSDIFIFTLGVLLCIYVLFKPASNPKEECLKSGGTAVEQPAGTFRKCLTGEPK